MVQTISSPLCEPMPFKNPVLKVTLNVTISKDGNYAFSKYSNESGDYVTVNPSSRIVMRYITKDVPWEPSQQVVVNQRNIYQLRLGFKKFYRIFQREDLFIYDDFGKIKELITDSADKVFIPLNNGQIIRLEPCIIYGERNEHYPGVTMVMNKEYNKVGLTIDEFECLFEILSTINIYQSGLTLLQTYIGMQKISVETTMNEYDKRKDAYKENSRGRYSGGSIFDRKEGSDKEISGPIVKNDKMELEDL